MAKAIQPAKTPRSKISPARETAFQLLRELASSAQVHSDDLLQGPKVEKLSAQDRNLCTALVMGVLRWQLALDVELAKLLTHKSKMDEPVRIALRLAMFQLLLMDRIPVHAAISDSVELTKRAGHRFASGLVNAVLRKAADQMTALKKGLRSDAAHPAWMLDRWKKALGDAAVAAVCDYDQQPPPTTLRLVDVEAEAALQQEGIQISPGAFLTTARHLVSGSIGNRDGVVRVQDEGSQLIAELLGAARLKPNSILDCCAAPGGKTAILAERYPEARIVAFDVSAKRLAAMQQRFLASPALALIEYKAGDITLALLGELYDLILCDVPCSGTGTLARNPEIKLRLQPEEFTRQQERQIAILRAAFKHLAPNGRLLYSTCSLEPEENEDVIAHLMAENKHVEIIPVNERIRELQTAGSVHEQGAAHLLQYAMRGDFLRTLPGISPCDGFFAALLTASR